MELKEFTKEFLPNIVQKENEFCKKYDIILYDEKGDIDTVWYNCFSICYFYEALQNFADKLCEKQRENCAESFIEAPLMLLEEDYYNGILNAEQPKIEELI